MISVIVLTRNRLARLQKLIAALQHQTLQDYEIVVVDTGSVDGTHAWLESCRLTQLKTVDFPPGKGGFAEARNEGITHARGDFIAYIDDDCIPPDDWLEKVSLRLEHYEAVGGATYAPPELKIPGWWSGELNWLVGLMPERKDASPSGAIYPQAANLGLRRSLAQKEPFQELKTAFGSRSEDTKIYRAGREDAELWWRLRVKGYNILFDPDIFVFHHIPPSRFRVSYLFRRAFMDGAVFYFRQRQKEYLPTALYQIFDLPTRILNRWFKREKLLPSLTGETFWTVRQMGYIKEYIRQERAVGEVLKSAGRRLKDYVAATAKSIGRACFVKGYRLIRPARSVGDVGKNGLLLVCSGYVGDFILIQPAVRALRQRFPDAPFTLLCNQPGQDLYAHATDAFPVDRIVTLPNKRTEQKQMIRALLEKERPAATVLFYYHRDYAAGFFFNSASPAVVSFRDDVGFSKRLWYELIDYPVEKNYEQNEIINHLTLVGKLIGEETVIIPEHYTLQISETARKKAAALVKDGERHRKIGINTGSALPEKRWQPSQWADLINLMGTSLDNVEIVLVGDKKEHSINAEILSSVNPEIKVINLAGATENLQELGAVLQRLDLLVTTDSGPKHIAFALDIPTVTLYGASDERRWGAYWNKERHAIMRAAPFDLTADELLGLSVNHPMRLISPRSVFEKVKELLSLLRSGA